LLRYVRNDDIEPGLERGGLFPLHNKLRDKLYIILLPDTADGFGGFFIERFKVARFSV
jgi:hypothetical protein